MMSHLCMNYREHDYLLITLLITKHTIDMIHNTFTSKYYTNTMEHGGSQQQWKYNTIEHEYVIQYSWHNYYGTCLPTFCAVITWLTFKEYEYNMGPLNGLDIHIYRRTTQFIAQWIRCSELSTMLSPILDTISIASRSGISCWIVNLHDPAELK